MKTDSESLTGKAEASKPLRSRFGITPISQLSSINLLETAPIVGGPEAQLHSRFANVIPIDQLSLVNLLDLSPEPETTTIVGGDDAQVQTRSVNLIPIDQLSSTNLFEISPETGSTPESASVSARLLGVPPPTMDEPADSQVSCGCGFNMNPGNTNGAVQKLKDQLKSMQDNHERIPAGSAVSQTYGGVVAFICHKKVNAYPVTVLPDQYGGMLEEVTDHCGLYVAGTWNGFALFRVEAGYMRYRPGLDFCHDSITSPAHSWPHTPVPAPRLGILQTRQQGDLQPRTNATIPWPTLEYYCGCGYNMNPFNTDQAVEKLKSQLLSMQKSGQGLAAGYAAWQTYGDVVAFICHNRGASTPTHTTPEKFGNTLADITNKCGRYIAGTFHSVDGLGVLGIEYGYMRFYPGLNFCSASTASSDHSCPHVPVARDNLQSDAIAPTEQDNSVALAIRSTATDLINYTNFAWCPPHFTCPVVAFHCGCGFNMDPLNCDRAVVKLKDQLRGFFDADGHAIPDEGIKPHSAAWQTYGDVVAFICNLSDETVRMQPDSFYGKLLGDITTHCGRYIAGTWSVRGAPEQAPPLDVGYMRYTPGLDFCKEAATSPVGSC